MPAAAGRHRCACMFLCLCVPWWEVATPSPPDEQSTGQGMATQRCRQQTNRICAGQPAQGAWTGSAPSRLSMPHPTPPTRHPPNRTLWMYAGRLSRSGRLLSSLACTCVGQAPRLVGRSRQGIERLGLGARAAKLRHPSPLPRAGAAARAAARRPSAPGTWRQGQVRGVTLRVALSSGLADQRHGSTTLTIARTSCQCRLQAIELADRSFRGEADPAGSAAGATRLVRRPAVLASQFAANTAC